MGESFFLYGVHCGYGVINGSLIIYLQNTPPAAERTANWLSAPEGDFNIYLRLYWPEQAVIDGAWPLPAITRVEE